MPRKYITKKSISEFTSPEKLPAHYEDEILEAFANYSLETDVKAEQLTDYFRDLRVPRVFTIGNKRLSEQMLVIEGTDVVDFDMLLTSSYHLVLFRDNQQIIQDTWNSLLRAAGDDTKQTINVADLKKIEGELKLGISNALLMDMVAVGSDGAGVEVTMTDFAYIMGKLGLLSSEQ